MAERRRRRRIKSSEDSEELSDCSPDELEIGKVSEAESVEEAKEPTVVDSEYESAEEEEEIRKGVEKSSENASEAIIPKAHEEPAKESKEPELPELSQVESLESPQVESLESPQVESLESPQVESLESPQVESLELPQVESLELSLVESLESLQVECLESLQVECLESPQVESPESSQAETLESPSQAETLESPSQAETLESPPPADILDSSPPESPKSLEVELPKSLEDESSKSPETESPASSVAESPKSSAAESPKPELTVAASEQPSELEVQNGPENIDGLDGSLNPVDEEGGVEETAEDTIIEGDDIEVDEEEEELADDDDDDDDDSDDGEDEVIEDESEWKEGERQQGDGQESQTSPKDKVLDDDEDKRNPQYIPKKGGFYEHDDRLFDNEEKEEEKKPKKKLWKDEGKWSHDRFKEEDQRPKSRDELMTTYGYDIRNEDGPPRARRRRRYGRGPNKYTRNWEDEDAYGKIAPRRSEGEFVRGRGGRGFIPRGRGRGFGRGGRGSYNNRDDFRRDDYRRPPPWQNQDRRPRSLSTGSARELDAVESRTILPSSSATPTLGSVQPVSVSASSTTSISTTSITFTNSKQSTARTDSESADCREEDNDNVPETPLIATNRSIKPFANSNNATQANANKDSVPERQRQTQTEIKTREINRSNYSNYNNRGMHPRGGGGDRRTFQHPPRKDLMRHGVGSSGDTAFLTKSMDRLSMRDSRDPRQSNREPRKEAKVAPTQHLVSPQERRQATVPPRMQDGAAASANRPKRYSSQRQRNVPETSSFRPSPPLPPPGQMPAQYFEHGLDYQAVSENMAGYQQPIYTEALSGSAPPPQGPAAQLLPPPPQSFQGYSPAYQETYTMRPIPSPPRIFAPVTMATGTIATGQPVMPAPYITANNNMMNYGPPPTNYTQYTFQQYPSPPPPQPAPNPQEIFRGGMAYYNTHSQPPHMHVPVKRPKAAIPIVPPPEFEEMKKDDVNGSILIEEEEEEEEEEEVEEVLSLDESPNVVASHVAVEG